MGSSCCRNVRVTSLPEQEPNQIEHNDVQQRKTSTSIRIKPPAPPPPSIPSGTRESLSDHSKPLEPIMPLSSIIPTDETTFTKHYSNDSKVIIATKLPPIHKSGKTRSSKDIQIEKNPDEKEDLSRTIHLPNIHANSINDDDILESVSDVIPSDDESDRTHDEWHVLPLPERDDFIENDRFYTSTPIPPSPEELEEDDDDEDENPYVPDFLHPITNNQIDSDFDQAISTLSLSQILRLREQLSIEEYLKTRPLPDLKLSPQSLFSLDDEMNLRPQSNDPMHDETESSHSLEDPTIYLSDTSLVPPTLSPTSTLKIEMLHSDCFDEEFVSKRQHVIENSQYRLIAEAWRPNTIEGLIDYIRNFTRNKPTIDRLWMIFYWIVRYIEYDTAPYVGRKLVDKSAEGVFRTRKTIADGYANLFKRLCDELDIKCEKITGYAKVYVFDPWNKSSAPIDHSWNVVQIQQFWYFIDVTWSTGHFDKNSIFKREPNWYFFLTRSNEMIYHHFPADEHWQLLKQPIKMAQYMQMPKIWPQFFQLGLKLLIPSNILYVDLVPNQSFALVLIHSPRYISLTGNFTLNEKEIEGGSRFIYDHRKCFYRCHFAPTSIGLHSIRLSAKNDLSENSSYHQVIEFELDVKQIPSNIISFPRTWRIFYDLNLEIVSPCNTHLIKMDHGDTHTEILIRAPSDIELSARLLSENGTKVLGGHCLYMDRRKQVWRCLFAPHKDGLFDALILARKRLDATSFKAAVRFQIKAKRIRLPALSYPKTWQLFHDLDLQIEIPRQSAFVPWPEYSSYTQVCIRAPEDVRLMGTLERKGIRIENGSLTQYHREKQYWQLLFAPEQIGEHKLFVFAQCNTPDGSVSGLVLEFQLDVTQLRQSIKFPIIYSTFLNKKCRIFDPMNGILKKGTLVYFNCEIPNARQVDLTVDSKWIKNEGYRNSVLKREVVVGTKEVIIYAKYDENTVYNELIKYIVQ